MRSTLASAPTTPVLKRRMKPLLLLAALLLGSGCASYRIQPGSLSPAEPYQRFFVQANLNDNHALDRLIASGLQARGFEAEAGPLTMRPRSTQVVVTYQDRWSWDFGEHIVYLRIALHKADSPQPYASATFSGPISLSKDASRVVDRLLTQLLSLSTRAETS